MHDIIMTDKKLAKRTPDVTVIHCGPGIPNDQKPAIDDEGTPIDPCCHSIIKGVTAAFGRHPETGSVFGQLSPRRMLVVFCAELLGMALLMFLGCMGGVYGFAGITEKPSGMQTAVVFGMTVASIIQMVGHISVAHLNPAVTLCTVLRGDINVAAAVVYLIAEVVGAILGFGLLLAVTPPPAVCECTTTPGAGLSTIQALLVEVAITAGLILVCNGSWDARNSRNTDSTSLKFGFYIIAISIAAGPYTGASMNPARTLAPAIWKGVWTDHWVYWAGPLVGSVVATLVYLLVLEERLTGTVSRRSSDSGHDVNAEKADIRAFKI